MKIGLTYTGNRVKQENYEKWLKNDVADIEIIKFENGKINANRIKDCDALVLSGGIDIHPKYYGSKKEDYKNHPEKFKSERDEFEISVFKASQENNLPVLGVCRGLQLINCVFGGNLKQNLGAALNKIHWRIDKDDADEGDKAHGVKIIPNTLLYEIAGAERNVANSAHHQAIKKIGKGLMINSLSDDGTIEGLERAKKKDKPFLLAIQWHPERMFKFHLEDSPLSKKIRDRFIEEIQKSKTTQK